MQDTDAAPHFARLFALLEVVVATNDYAHPAVDQQVAAAATAAREAGVRPEAVIAYLRRHLHEAPLSAVGDWYRGVLVERLVARAITAYFAITDDAGTAPAPPEGSLPGTDRSQTGAWPPIGKGL